LNMSIKVTVGIVARNEEEYLARTLESLVDQDFPPDEYEVLVVDGDSQDHTREVARRVLEESGLQHSVYNEKDYGSSGLCFARNLVIDNSDAEARYIAYTDADCILARDWLRTLYQAVESSGGDVAGAGGPRLIAPTPSKKELVINAFITSLVASGGNPAFSQRKVAYLESIPNYNAIYKKEIISKFRYDESLVISDDHELNYRLHQAGYLFQYLPEARVYHRETDSVVQFTRNMFRYGFNMASLLRKHLHFFKVKVILTLTMLAYLILLVPLYLLLGSLALVPPLLYLVYAVLAWVEVLLRTRTLWSLMVFLLMPLQHLAYACGVIYNFLTPHRRV
jgi:cellulose synthase/poly-beta-1,6-N-acetylglucosamine synthase-like glycosyltransferase